MKITVNKIVTLIAIIGFSACSSPHSSDAYASSDAMDVSSAEVPEVEPVNIERKLIKTGEIRFQTDDLKTTRTQIAEALQKYKGYISFDEESNYGQSITNTLQVRIPANSFDAFLADATKGVNRFDSKNINTQDVTEAFLDIQVRLQTKKNLEARYNELLKKANTVSEILEIEAQANTLRADIESMEGRLKYLENQVSYSTLSIVFYEQLPETSGFGYKFTGSLRSGWDNLVSFTIVLIEVWPFILIAIVCIVLVRRKLKKRKAAQKLNK